MLDLTNFRGLDEELVVDTSEGQRQFLLVSDKEDYIKLSSSAYRLLREVRAGRSFESLAAELSRQGGRPVSAADVEAAHTSVTARIEAIVSRGGSRSAASGFWLRLRLISAVSVARVASRLSFTYRPAVAASLFLFICATFGYMFSHGLRLEMGGSAVWLGYGLFVLSLLVHELGHAAACERYGATPSEIGFTLYLTFPAFYSDVTSAWQLKRWQRVVVDLGGTFLQFVVAGLYAAAFLISGWEPLRAAFAMILYGALFSLNPIFKFDGYWVLADALGVTDLHRQPTRIVRHVVSKLTRRSSAPLPWPAWVSLVLFVYTPISLLAWGYFLAQLLPFLLAKTLSYPEAVLALWRSFSSANGSSADWLGTLGSFLATTLILAVAWYGTFATIRAMVLKPLVTGLRKVRARLDPGYAVAR